MGVGERGKCFAWDACSVAVGMGVLSATNFFQQHGMSASQSAQRALVLGEIIQSEKDHIADLGMTESNVLLPLKARMKHEQALLQSVSTNLSMIRNFNTVLLEELTNQAALPVDKQLIGKVFVRLSDFSKMLVQYCGSQPTFLQVVAQERKTDKSLDAFLDDAKKACRGLDLGQLLLKPVQRTCKYPLLLQELLKATSTDHVDHGNVEEAIAKTSAVVSSLNEGQKLLESFAKIAQLAADIKHDVPDFDLFHKGRMFVREGPFEELSEHGKRRSLVMILFDDVLLVGKYKKKQFQYRSHHPVTQLECASLPAKYATEFELGFTIAFKGDAPLNVVWPSKDVRYLWFHELTELSKGKGKPAKSHVASTQSSAASAGAVAQRKAKETEEKMQKWRASLDAKAGTQLDELKKEAEARKRYDEVLSRGSSLSLSARKATQFPSFVTAVPENIGDVGLLLQMAQRYVKGTRPELVVIGEGGAGRSSLIDAMLGANVVAGVSTSKIIRIELKNAQKCAPSWTVGGEKVVSAEEARELYRRELGKKSAEDTVVIKHESPFCFSALLIDTPALGVNAKQDARIRAECSPSSRTLLCVEVAKRWDGISTFPYVVRANLDPSLERSLFVYTKFSQQLQLFLQPQDLSAYLKQCPLPSLSYFVTLPNPMTDSTLADEEERQRSLLAQFRFDDDWQPYFSLHLLLRKMNARLFDFFVNEVFPAALVKFEADSRRSQSNLKQRTLETEANLQELVRKTLASHFGRVAIRYACLMEGSWGEVSRTGLGVTQAEEAAKAGVKWQAQELGASEERPNVPFAACKLAAGAKLQRLVNEFRQVVAHACDASRSTLTEGEARTDVLAESIVVPSFAAMGIARERRYAALAKVIGPACNTLGTRVLSLVQETVAAANSQAISAVPTDELESEILNRCRLSLVVQSTTALAERCAVAFRDACNECIVVHLESEDLASSVADLLHRLVVGPLTDANVVLNALHTALAAEGIDSIFNRSAFRQDLSNRVRDAKREADVVRDSCAVFAEKTAKIKG